MKEHVSKTISTLMDSVQGEEVLSVYVRGEKSSFVRFNHGKVRQPGTVEQCFVDLSLVDGGRQASAAMSLAFDGQDDSRLRRGMAALRQQITTAAVDPYLNVYEGKHQDEKVAESSLPGVSWAKHHWMRDAMRSPAGWKGCAKRGQTLSMG